MPARLVNILVDAKMTKAITEVRKLARICKALSAETRVRIVQLLKNRALCVGALSVRLGITQGAVSQHLRVLRDAGIVTPDRRGCYVHYRLNVEALAMWKEAAGGLLDTRRSSTRLFRSCAEKPTKRKGEGECASRVKAVKNRKT